MRSNGLCVADRSTDELLRDFQSQNGVSQAAFEEIVRRYAGMVYSVCLQVTRDVHDAEDATQAAFLTLALRAKTAENIKYLGPWLQKVARRLSLDIMRAKNRRKKREERRGELARLFQQDRDPRNGLDRAEMSDVIRDELGKLPAKYRLPLILHYFGGMRPEEVARELGYKPSTLGVRLHRGRKMLADSLAGRGITISAAMLTTVLAGLVHQGIGDNVIAQASLAAAGLSTNGELPAALISARVLGLTRHAASAMMWAKAKAVIATMLMATTALAGSAQIIRAITPIELNLHLLNPMYWIRTMLRSPVSAPRFSSIEPASSIPLNPLPSDHYSGAAADRLAPPVANRSAVQSILGGSPGGIDVEDAGATLSMMTQNLEEAPVLGVSSGSASMAVTQAARLDPPIARLQDPALLATFSSPDSFPAGFVLDPATRAIFHSSGSRQFDQLVLGSRTGAFDSYVMSGSAQLTANRLVVGESASGKFDQSGGQVHIAGDLILAQQRDIVGSYHLDGTALLTARNEYIGFGGAGQLVQTGGTNIATAVHIAQQPGSRGTYTLNGGSLRVRDRLEVAVGGSARFDQSGGEVSVGDGTVPGTLSVGVREDSDGHFEMSGGTLHAGKIVVGDAGNGNLVQSGGVTSVNSYHVGDQITGTGNAILSRGDLQIGPAGSVIVGNMGNGTFVVGYPRGAFNIHESAPNAGVELKIRARSTGKGTFVGFGDVALTGPIVQNGRVIADGFGQSRELDLSTASFVTNTIDNSEAGGRNGWSAQRGGKLVLPPIKVPYDRTATWGEDPLDPIPDLVNSVRFSVRGVSEPGQAILSLMAADYEHVPTLPSGEQFVGIWGFDRRDLVFGSASLLIRYDDSQIRRVHGDEDSLRLWTFTKNWELVPREWTLSDGTLHLLYGQVGGDFRLFGVSVPLGPPTIPASIPEPGALVVGAIACGALLRRRRL